LKRVDTIIPLTTCSFPGRRDERCFKVHDVKEDSFTAGSAKVTWLAQSTGMFTDFRIAKNQLCLTLKRIGTAPDKGAFLHVMTLVVQVG
jgi:hypothetical protein